MFAIVQGPDRLAILMAFAQYGKHARRVPADAVLGSPDIVFFVCKCVVVGHPGGERKSQVVEVKFYVTVTSLQHIDKKAKAWNIEGRLMGALPLPHGLEYDSYEPARQVQIRYRTDTKEGQLTVIGS